jgi:hypothetical protein
LAPKKYFSDSDGFEVLEHGEAAGESFSSIRHLQVGQTEHGSGRAGAGIVYQRNIFSESHEIFFWGEHGQITGS